MNYVYTHYDGVETASEDFLSRSEDIKKNKVAAVRACGESEKEMYYVRLHNNKLFDPNDDSHKTRRGVEKFRQVKKDIYDSYLMYIKTKRKPHFLFAERAI